MSPRQARKERRAAERKARKAELRHAKGAAVEIGFVSQNAQLPADTQNRDRQGAENGFVSQTRAAINRANAQCSTGPRTPAGKLALSRNSLKHGLASGALLIPGEDPAAFEALLHELLEEHQPANSTEELLIKDMAQSWRLAQRAIRLQNDCFSENSAEDERTGRLVPVVRVDHARFSLFLRYQTTHDRAFYKALHTLLRLQKERRQSELRFVSQTALEPVEIQNRDRQGPAFGFVSQNLPVCPPPTAQKSAEAA